MLKIELFGKQSNESSDKNIRPLAMSSSTNNKLPAQQNTTNPPLEPVDNNMPTTASIIGGIPNLKHSLSLDKDGIFNIVADNPEILQALKKALISKSKSTPQSYENPNSQTHATEIRGENQQEKVSSAKQKHSDPKISSNFDPPPKNKTPPNQIAPNTQAITTANDTQISNNTAQTNNIDDDTQVQTKIGTGKVKSSVPSKPTFAAAVQEALAAKDESASNINIKHGTHLGKPAVYFNAEDYFVNLAKECKFTIVGKFTKGKPTMEELRKLFVRQYHLKGSVKIAYYDYRTVYIDFTNETNFNHIYFKPFIHLGQYTMKVMKWTPKF
ncbi:hypothetical protein FXO38_08401 [Capsicum annuum]|nr:hypothetical protein FXO37_15942 [Capsicum annuum]KAF3667829.1 hypothetical protein FXO38_08401 [Capsicum annuum]